MQFRNERLAHHIQEEASAILHNKLKDPRLGTMTSVTRVELNRDNSLATIYISVFGSEADGEKTVEALDHASGFIRRELGKAMNVRSLPELRFRLDRSIDNVVRVEELLSGLKPPAPANDGTPETRNDA